MLWFLFIDPAMLVTAARQNSPKTTVIAAALSVIEPGGGLTVLVVSLGNGDDCIGIRPTLLVCLIREGLSVISGLFGLIFMCSP
jgi:hypothetical protein